MVALVEVLRRQDLGRRSEMSVVEVEVGGVGRGRRGGLLVVRVERRTRPRTARTQRRRAVHCIIYTPPSVKASSHRHAGHDTNRTVLSCLVWRCELSRPDSQTGAFCVWSVSECVGRHSATAGRTLTQNALVRRSVHTRHDKTRLPRLPVDRRRRNTGQAGSYA